MKKISKKAAIAMPVSVLFFVVVAGITINAASVSESTHRIAVAASHKAQANELAESGIMAMYDKTWRQLRLDGSLPAGTGTVTLTSTVDNFARTAGTYSASISNSTVTTTDLGGGKTQYNYSITLTSTGTAPNGTSSKKTANFTGSIVKQAGGGAPIAFGPGAIQSNTDVNLKIDQGLRTYDAVTLKDAHIFANQGVTWTMKDGTKNTTNPNVIDLQGQLQVANAPTSTYYEFTKTYFGVFNPNGVTNFKTLGDASQGIANNNVVPGNQRVYPTSTAVSNLMTTWESMITAAGGKTHLLVNSLLVLPTNPYGKVIDLPAVIEGDLTVGQGDTLRLRPTNADPAKNVLIVKGNINNYGQLFNLGGVVAVKGKYTDTATSEDRIDLQNSPYTMTQALNHSALMSTSTADDAIKITTNSSSTYGLVYAANGGARVTGNLELSGVLISGGTTASGGVEVTPNGGNSFVVKYTPDALTNKLAFAAGNDGTSTTPVVVTPFLPTSLYGWSTQ